MCHQKLCGVNDTAWVWLFSPPDSCNCKSEQMKVSSPPETFHSAKISSFPQILSIRRKFQVSSPPETFLSEIFSSFLSSWIFPIRENFKFPLPLKPSIQRKFQVLPPPETFHSEIISSFLSPWNLPFRENFKFPVLLIAVNVQWLQFSAAIEIDNQIFL